MIARLGNVLYWIGCGVASFYAAVGLYGALYGRDPAYIATMSGGIAIAAWLIGRACRYVLTGR